MKTLLILRHAKSSWDDSELEDQDRPLNKRGRRDAPRMGKLMVDQGLVPDMILSSAALRARQTVEGVLEAFADKAGEYHGDICFQQELYAASQDVLLGALKELPASANTTLLVAHNPGLEDLLAYLTGEPQHLPTAALASVRLPIDAWQALPLQGEPVGSLAGLWKPKELD